VLQLPRQQIAIGSSFFLNFFYIWYLTMNLQMWWVLHSFFMLISRLWLGWSSMFDYEPPCTMLIYSKQPRWWLTLKRELMGLSRPQLNTELGYSLPNYRCQFLFKHLFLYRCRCAHTHNGNWLSLFVATSLWHQLQFGLIWINFFIGAHPTCNLK
jgi:hypothetical protein